MTISSKISAITSADDFMRLNSTKASSKKAARWQNDIASGKQQALLTRMGYPIGVMSKIVAAAHITFRFNQKKIEKILGV